MEQTLSLLKIALFRQGDDLSASTREFFNWLQNHLAQSQTTQFTALDLRMAKYIHPRTLSRYLHELCTLRYIQIASGNRYRGGYRYQIINTNDDNTLNKSIEKVLKNALKSIKSENANRFSEPVGMAHWLTGHVTD